MSCSQVDEGGGGKRGPGAGATLAMRLQMRVGARGLPEAVA